MPDPSPKRRRRTAAATTAALDAPTSYRLIVVASNARQAVVKVGGWLFDHGMLGWKSVVALADGTDARAVHLLGASTAELEWVSDSYDAFDATVLAIGASCYLGDRAARQLVNTVARGAFNAILLWPDDGNACRAQPPNLIPGHHRLSNAARVYKSHSCAMLRLRPQLALRATERFFLMGQTGPLTVAAATGRSTILD